MIKRHYFICFEVGSKSTGLKPKQSFIFTHRSLIPAPERAFKGFMATMKADADSMEGVDFNPDDIAVISFNRC